MKVSPQVPGHRRAFYPEPLAAVCLLLCLLLVSACSRGGGNSSPTEPPHLRTLEVDWEYFVDEDDGPVSGRSYPIPGNTIVLLNQPASSGGSCTKDGVWADCLFIYGDDGEILDVVWQPENVRFIAECRTTPDGEVQAYYHDPYSHVNPGALGPLVTSGCSRAEEWDHYAQCCFAES